MANKINTLNREQSGKLFLALDKARAELADTPLPMATERLSRELGFVLTQNNVKNAADAIGVEFKRQTAAEGGKKWLHTLRERLDAADKLVAELRTQVETLTQRLAAVESKANAAHTACGGHGERLNALEVRAGVRPADKTNGVPLAGGLVRR